MTAMLYFIPGGQPGITIDQVRAAGLGRSFGDELVPSYAANGPGNEEYPATAGVVVADPTRIHAARIQYLPDKQTWMPVPWLRVKASERELPIWVGYYSHAKPGPSDLARDRQLPGYMVQLGDSRKWLIPVVRALEEVGLASEDAAEHPTELQWQPALRILAYGKNERGEWVNGEILPQYRELWQSANEWWDVINGFADENLRKQWAFNRMLELGVDALAVNYRIADYDAIALGLLAGDVIVEALNALVDLPKFQGVLKKKLEAAGFNSSDGQEASTEPTAQP